MLSGLSGTDLLIFVVSLIISMSIHEAMHGFMAHWLGDTTAKDMGRLTLNPFKHIDLVTTLLLPLILVMSGLPPFFAAKPVPFNPSRVRFDEFGAALVGIAGPITNLLLAVIAGIVLHVSQPIPGTFSYNAIIIFAEVNVGFFIFNMIPFPPLDGSRLLYAFAPEPLQNFMRQIEAYGFISILVFVLILFQFVSGPITHLENGLLNFLL